MRNKKSKPEKKIAIYMRVGTYKQICDTHKQPKRGGKRGVR